MRPMRAADMATVTDLCHQLGYPQDEAAVAGRFELLDGRAEHTLLVAEVDGAVAGWIHAFEFVLLEEERSVEVGGLVVAEAHRNRGVGKALLGAAERWAAERGVGMVWLRSRDSRQDAHRFYLREGYEHLKTSLTLVKRLDR